MCLQAHFARRDINLSICVVGLKTLSWLPKPCHCPQHQINQGQLPYCFPWRGQAVYLLTYTVLHVIIVSSAQLYSPQCDYSDIGNVLHTNMHWILPILFHLY